MQVCDSFFLFNKLLFREKKKFQKVKQMALCCFSEPCSNNLTYLKENLFTA